jgi:tetratricopeptide (TPR) repeat protein
LEEIRLGDRRSDGPWLGCHLCYYRDLALAFDKAEDVDSAIVMYERVVNMPSRYTLLVHTYDLHNFLRRLGELYEAKGNREKAIEYYSRFVELWRNADPELQPQVAAIRARLTRLRSS